MNIAKMILIFTALSFSACRNPEDIPSELPASETVSIVGESRQGADIPDNDNAGSETAQSKSTQEVSEMKISIGGTEYTAHFYDTKAAEEFKAMLPLTLDMSELNGNEKYIYMDSGFTTASEKVGSIKKGELMLYGSDCVVLFYDSFKTPYSYTRLGYIDDPSGLEKTAGSGSVTVDFYTE